MEKQTAVRLCLMSGVFFLFFLLSCQKETRTFTLSPFQEIENPSGEGGEPRFYQDNEGRLWLSWIEYTDDTTSTLMLTQQINGQWATAVEVASGTDWFTNWADFPAITGWNNHPNSLLAHWLQKSSKGTFDYDVMLRISNDAGQNWGQPFKLHQDTVAAEHGFVSFVAEGDQIFATWLDGRNTPSDGPMSLRAACIKTNGQITDTILLDNRICDCCQTAATATANGRLVAYRDRSEKEIRDISLVRFADGQWSQPYSVHADDWTIAGCPVNGPSLAHQGDSVALVWFSGKEDGGSNYITFSTDGGQSFGAKTKLNEGPTLGRVQVAMLDNGSALALWMEPLDDKAQLFLQEVKTDGTKGVLHTVAEVSASRSTGFPQLVVTADEVFISYTHVGESTQRLQILAATY